jgi:DNA processing protein
MFDNVLRLFDARRGAAETLSCGRAVVERMEIDALDALQFAVVATRHAGGPRALATRLRREGPRALDQLFDALQSHDRVTVMGEAEALLAAGVRATILGDSKYPESLAQIREAPPALFYLGTARDLKASGLGMCGARNASPEGLRAANACGAAVALAGLSVVSGYARGVDMATHVAALKVGGRTMIVLAEGITKFRVKKGEFADSFDPARVTIVSQFSPTAPWSTGSAMTRNGVIFGASSGLVVVEAGEAGGTLDAGLRALDAGRRVLALEFDGMLPGNKMLIARGAIPIRSRADLVSLLAIWDRPEDGTGQLVLG